MEEIDHSSSPMNPDIIGEEVVHHTGELSQHREIVDCNSLVTRAHRVSYNELSKITGQTQKLLGEPRIKSSLKC